MHQINPCTKLQQDNEPRLLPSSIVTAEFHDLPVYGMKLPIIDQPAHSQVGLHPCI